MSGFADKWARVEIGSPLPENAVRVKGQQNMYVALWHCDGQPVSGRAWVEGGVVECSFPYMDRELTAKEDLGDEIHVLTSGGPYAQYWHEWVALGDWRGLQRHLDVVRCGQATPVLLRADDGTKLLGNVDLATERASFGYRGTVEVISGEALQQALVICRNLDGCPEVSLVDDRWMDVREQDAFPANAVQALDRPLHVGGGGGGVRDRAQYVGLWYKHGKVLMGRAVERHGRVCAYFCSDGVEYSGDVGSLQLLTHPPAAAAFAYSWRPLSAASTGGWRPVQVGGVAPCVIANDGMERLGQLQLEQRRASVAWADGELILDGPQVKSFRVLCRDNWRAAKSSTDVPSPEAPFHPTVHILLAFHPFAIESDGRMFVLPGQYGVAA